MNYCRFIHFFFVIGSLICTTTFKGTSFDDTMRLCHRIWLIWVNLITTSLFSLTLESWFISGKSSPNGRKIQVSEILWPLPKHITTYCYRYFLDIVYFIGYFCKIWVCLKSMKNQSKSQWKIGNWWQRLIDLAGSRFSGTSADVFFNNCWWKKQSWHSAALKGWNCLSLKLYSCSGDIVYICLYPHEKIVIGLLAMYTVGHAGC